MPTLPPQHPPQHPLHAAPQVRESHQARELAESFGADPERYDRARPRYPAALVTAVTAGHPGAAVLDVGCGTGIAARQFREAGCTVLGVEVDARMADWARRHGLTVEVAPFERWESAGRTFDVLVAAQAWHWVDPVTGAVKAAEVLRPGGRLAVFWNVDQPPAEVAEAFAAVYRRVAPDSLLARRPTTSGPGAYAGLPARAADGIRAAGAFGPAEQWRHDWERSYTRDQWLDLLPTSGAMAQVPPAARARLLAGIGEAIDAVGGAFTMGYTTLTVTALRS
ncbi:class I SAM-dependent methyltransferase [Kitasatospora sp. LaBMicrA B282]|uniref:class I SAM-dependent methyltransferase n=1 Tax=Kitasatospora sp. LaBMicrA B282 TaxID=3420949 RepID=UPI003D133C85